MLSVTPLPQLKENKAQFEAAVEANPEPLSEEEQADCQEVLRLLDEAIAAKTPGVFVTIVKAILVLVILLVCLAVIAFGCVFLYILVTSM